MLIHCVNNLLALSHFFETETTLMTLLFVPILLLAYSSGGLSGIFCLEKELYIQCFQCINITLNYTYFSKVLSVPFGFQLTIKF